MSRQELFEAINTELGLGQWTGAYRLTSSEHEFNVYKEQRDNIADCLRNIRALREIKNYPCYELPRWKYNR